MDPKSIKNLKTTNECLNCHIDISNHNYCPNCGQQNVDKQASLRDFFRDAIGDLFTFDHKFFRSFKPLLLKPGFLTNEYNKGRRVNYILPLRLYFFVSLVFFFFNSISSNDDDSFLNIETSRFLPSDTIVDFFENYEAINEYDAFQLSRSYGKKFNRIKLNDKGRIFDTFLRQNYDFEDSLRSSYAFRMYHYFDIEEETPEEIDERDSSYVVSKISREFGLSENESEDIFLNLSQFYTVDQNHGNSSKIGKSSFLLPEIKRFVEDTAQANFLHQELKINFRFYNHNSNVDVGLDEVDSTENRMWYDFLKSIEKKAIKINSDESAGIRVLRMFFDKLPNIIFFLLPIFALILKLFYIRKKIFYINHLIFALHSHTIIFLYIFLLSFFESGWIYAFVIPGIWFHLYFSLRNVYGQGKIMSFIKLNTIFFIYTIFVSMAGMIGLFISFMQV